MCGIAGFIHFDRDRPASAGIVRKMTDTIVHRGPDGEGHYTKQNIALGHRRLAIIDLSTGHQPMYSNDQKIVLVFNGEIYNYVELREELIKLGRQFTTTSDTEVIIHAYQTWGIDCQKRFNGMWAFALWDEHNQRLFLSRDRIGEKPLYYTTFDRSLIFGSEIKAVVAYGVPTQPRKEMTELYLTLSFIPAPYTFYENIHQLAPGQYLLADNKGIKISNYWDLPDISENDLVKDRLTIEQGFAELFDDSVRIRMRSDVDFGAFLSGGLDSSCIVSTMTKHTAKPVQTFTIGFENKQFDESHLAKLVAEKYGTNHHQGVVSAEHFDAALEKVLFHYDEPFGDASAIPTGHVSGYAARYVKMVLTGDGGDEVLSGYTIYQGGKFAQQYQTLPATLRRLLPSLIKTASKPLRGKMRYHLNRVAGVLDSSNQSFEQRLLSKLAHILPEDLKEITRPCSKAISFHEYYADVMKNCRFKDPFYKLMYFQHKVTLPGDMLTKVDRMSMAHSIETRIPFLDHRIVELMFRAHKNIKTTGYINKVVLRNTVANHSLPKQLLKAPKKGFSVPLRDWFRDQNLHRRIKEIISTDNTFPLYNSAEIERLIEQNRSGTSDAGNFIWMALVLKKWSDSFKLYEQKKVALAE